MAAQGNGPDRRAETATALPQDALVVVPVRNMVLFPGLVAPLTLGRRRSVAAAQEAARHDRPLGVLLQRDPEVEEPSFNELHRIGTLANVMRYVTGEDGSHHVVCQGVQRFRVLEFLDGHPFFAARVERLEEPEAEGTEVEALFHNLRRQALEALELLPQTPQELVNAVRGIDAPGLLADMVTSYMDLKLEEKQEILDTLALAPRLKRVSAFLSHRIEVLRLSREIGEKARESIDERQREYMLREQLNAIREQLGEGDERSAEVEALSEAVAKAGMPEEVEQHARKELKRLERMPEAAAEHSMLRTYLEWLTELPWAEGESPPIDIEKARRILDEDHYGLEKVKRRILEYLAVHKLNPEGKSPILCFVGPPGVGKTSLGQSIARATGRPFVRLSLGGVHDESEIRGHRRTYVGALPGNIIQAVRKAGARTCLMMLDEMDKLGASFHGDPSAALLEVLDPEQNHAFRDNYLAVSFDLSKVMFIGTANVLDGVPGPLRDRMEVIELPGYTEEEKVQIARRYLLRRQRDNAGLSEDLVQLPEETVRRIIRDYTREAGVRNLEREIGAVMRHTAVKVAEGRTEPTRIGPDDLPAILGAPRFEAETAMRTSVPGAATGLAWTPTGGDILFIEATRTPGAGKLILTGQLGDVMKESAQAALSLVKSRAAALGVDAALFEKSDIHVHVPAGAIPKDGPSAGVAMYCALVSLLTERCVRSDTAVTGEISLRGLVLPVGGIKEKVTAAARADIRRVLLPSRNRKDFDDIPEDARRRLDFVWLDTVDDAAAAALEEREKEKSPKT